MGELSKRLRAIAGLVPGSCRVMADIGADHGRLALAICRRLPAVRVIASEFQPGPLSALRAAVRAAGADGRVMVCAGDGLQAIPGWLECDTVVIAGMGGKLIAGVLQRGREKLAGVRRLVLQPMTAGRLVRKWLLSNGWAITDELLVNETGRLYEVLAAEPGNMVVDDPDLYEIGPLIWARRVPGLVSRLNELAAAARRVLTGMMAARRQVPSARLTRQYEKMVRMECKKYVAEMLAGYKTP
ncbi:MAG: class I SAM-dependent methyltransferase [Negativicutes bacterium]|nr:class I SAM-dependent methyltransferase [Negativicutes bacterium]